MVVRSATKEVTGRLATLADPDTGAVAITLSDLQRADAVPGSPGQTGHEVCPDDFGAGAAAFQDSRHLSLDFVEPDAATRRSCSVGDARPRSSRRWSDPAVTSVWR